MTAVPANRPLTTLPPGVYLNLDEETYHSDWSLGSTALKVLQQSPPDWWWFSPFNTAEQPEPEKDTDERRLGTALHKIVLEGIPAYEAAYDIRPSKESHPKALVTDAHIKAALMALGKKPASGNKDVRVSQLIDADPGVQILDILQEDFDKRVTKDGKPFRAVSVLEDRKIRLIHRMIMRSPDALNGIKSLEGEHIGTLSDAFTGVGLSEVSVFWVDDDGIPQRCRFDRLKPNVTIDFKSFSSWKSGSFKKKTLLREAKIRGYPRQTAHYEEGRRQLRKLVAAGKIFGGTFEQREILIKIAAATRWAWVWVFCKTKGAPEVKGLNWKTVMHYEDGTTAQSMVYARALQDRKEGLANFIHYRSFFDLVVDQMWFDPKILEDAEDSDWPDWASNEER